MSVTALSSIPALRVSAIEPIRENLNNVRRTLARVAAENDPAMREVTLVGVTKGFAPDIISKAIDAGLTAIGENYVQEALPKVKLLRLWFPHISIHFVGRLQRNKVKHVVGMFDVIQGVDTLELGLEIAKQAHRADVRQEAYLQVNIANDPCKGGFLPRDLFQAIETLAEHPAIRVRGLMMIGSREAMMSLDDAKQEFEMMQELHQRVYAQYPVMRELSMGMSNDFGLAVEYGATVVRVGRSIFGERTG